MSCRPSLPMRICLQNRCRGQRAGNRPEPLDCAGPRVAVAALPRELTLLLPTLSLPPADVAVAPAVSAAQHGESGVHAHSCAAATARSQCSVGAILWNKAKLSCPKSLPQVTNAAMLRQSMVQHARLESALSITRMQNTKQAVVPDLLAAAAAAWVLD